MQYGDRRVRIEREFIRFESAELYVGSERLGDLLGVMFAVDWSDLTATVIDPSSLPIARRLRREAARDAYLRRPDGLRADVTLGLQRPSWDGVVVDYSLFSPSNDPLGGSTYGFGLGADVGAARSRCWHRVSAQRIWAGCTSMPRGPASGGRTAGSSSCGWAMSRPRARAAARWRASRSRTPLRPAVASRIAAVCRTPRAGVVGGSVPGRRSRGVRFADASGGFAINLPVRYGENPVDFVAYGPFGEIREFNRTYRVLSELLPARRFEYGLSAGRCPQPSFICNATTNLDVRYGATARWTVQGGLDQFWRDSLPDRTHPYADAGRKSEQRLGDPKRGDRCGTRAWRAAIRAVDRSAVGRRVRPLFA